LIKIRVINRNEELEYNIVFSLRKKGGTTKIYLLNPLIEKNKYYIMKEQSNKISYFTDSIEKMT
jgi:hypothetical protein